MARDDYFVLVYRILKYLEDCFVSGENPDIDMISPETLKIPNGYWTNIVESIYNEGYVTGVYVIPRAGGAPGIKFADFKITQKGLEYLSDNSKMKKVARFIKTTIETVSGI